MRDRKDGCTPGKNTQGNSSEWDVHKVYFEDNNYTVEGGNWRDANKGRWSPDMQEKMNSLYSIKQNLTSTHFDAFSLWSLRHCVN